VTVSVDPHGTIGFHPLCSAVRAVLPNHSLGRPGEFTGTLVKHGDYEIFGKAFFSGRQNKTAFVGRVKILEDLLQKAAIPNL